MYRLFFLLLLSLSCTTTTTYTSSECVVQLHSAAPAWVESGALIEVQGSPLTTHFDTAAYIGGLRATVLRVDRSSCDECDSCRATEGCGICTDCDACDALCRESCIETATMVVPELSPGPSQVEIYNSYGHSNPIDIEVVRSPNQEPGQGLDTGSEPSSSSDSGASDSAQGGDSGSDSGDAGAEEECIPDDGEGS